MEQVTINVAALRTAALALYYAGHWTSDRLTDEESAKLWTELRDALGLPTGTSPKKLSAE